MEGNMTEEIYPMPMFPMLVVNDLEASSNFYQIALGFKHIFTMQGPGGQPALVHLRWAKYADLLMSRPRDDQELSGSKGVGISLNFNMVDHFNGDMDAFAKHARANGATITGPINHGTVKSRCLTLRVQLIFTMPLKTHLV
jgi:uncharacterized glyoxalase superfamily protein PhnB